MIHILTFLFQSVGGSGTSVDWSGGGGDDRRPVQMYVSI